MWVGGGVYLRGYGGRRGEAVWIHGAPPSPPPPPPRFDTDEEAVQMANRTEYGLAAYFYTRDLARAWRVAEELEFGEGERREEGGEGIGQSDGWEGRVAETIGGREVVQGRLIVAPS